MTAPPAAGKAPAAGQEQQQTDIPESLKAAKEEYGEVNGALVDEIVALRGTVSRLEAAQASQEEQQRARDELGLREFLAGEEQKLATAHSDWGDVVVSPDFVNWVRSPDTPEFIRVGIARNGNGIVDGQEAAAIIDLYKGRSETGALDPTALRRARQLEGARTVPSRTPGATAAGVPDEFHAAWNAMRQKEESQRRQRQSG